MNIREYATEVEFTDGQRIVLSITGNCEEDARLQCVDLLGIYSPDSWAIVSCAPAMTKEEMEAMAAIYNVDDLPL